MDCQLSDGNVGVIIVVPAIEFPNTARDNLSSAGYIGDIDSKRMVRRLPYPTTEKSSNLPM